MDIRTKGLLSTTERLVKRLQTVYEITYGADGSPLGAATGMAARSSSGRGSAVENVPVETPCSLGREHIGNRRTR